MREIIHLQVGQCGNVIGNQFWEILCNDHGLDRNGYFIGEPGIRLEYINVFFTELKGLRFCPRSVMIDLDKSSLEAMRSTSHGELFKPDNYVFGVEGTGNNWAKGHFSEGAYLCAKSLEVIRKEAEGCDCLSGFQMVHSLGGGTGAGLGSLLIDKIKEEYPGSTLSSYSVIPSPNVSSTVVEPCNAVLTINHLIESTDETFVVDNEALSYIASNTMKIKQPSYCDFNYFVVLAMSGITSSMRFPGPTNCSLRKIAVNMTPFPRLHFFVPTFAPLVAKSSTNTRKYSIAEMTSQLFDYKNLFAACDVRNGKFLTVSCLFRGDISMRELDQQMHAVQNRESASFVDWIPDNIKTNVCNVPFPGITRTATLIANTTSIKDVLKRIKTQYLAMYQRKAFLHWYTGEGLNEREFKEAEANVSDLIDEYKEYELATFDLGSPKPCP